MNKKFKAIHLLSGMNERRVIRSIEEVSQLQRFGIEYKQIHNELYEELPPKETCLRPHAISAQPGGMYTKYGFEWNLTPRSYGCYLAHKNGILENFDNNLNGLLVFECDAVCCIPLDEFYIRLCRADELCEKHGDIFVLTFGFRFNGWTLEKIEELEIVSYFLGTHSYFIPRTSREAIFELFRTKPWDSADLFFTHHCTMDHLKIAIFDDRPIWVQADGISYLQGKFQDSENHFRRIRYPLKEEQIG